MNGAQDLGGMDGFGPIDPEPNEPVFHERWEARVFALSLAMGGQLPHTLDAWRHLREQLDPVEYLTASYYEQWLTVLERQLFEEQLVTPRELETRARELATEAP